MDKDAGGVGWSVECMIQNKYRSIVCPYIPAKRWHISKRRNVNRFANFTRKRKKSNFANNHVISEYTEMSFTSTCESCEYRSSVLFREF